MNNTPPTDQNKRPDPASHKSLLPWLILMTVFGVALTLFTIFREKPSPDQFQTGVSNARVEGQGNIRGNEDAGNSQLLQVVTFPDTDLKTFQVFDLYAGTTGWTVNDSLLLVNKQFGLPDDYLPTMAEYRTSGVHMNVAMLEDYGRMSDAVREQTGEPVWVLSVFRSPDDQKPIYEEDPVYGAKPGHSEHHTGLALDLHTTGELFTDFTDTKQGQYVADNSWRFGFILRYPKGRESETGIPYESWHVRYVGQPHATIMWQENFVFEQYINALKPGNFYRFGDYIISRQEEKTELTFPKNASQVICSSDNTGHFIITGKVPAV